MTDQYVKIENIGDTDWNDGHPPSTAFTSVPGDGIDGYAREVVVTPENWFTHVPQGYSAAEAATLTCAGLTAWRALFVNKPFAW